MAESKAMAPRLEGSRAEAMARRRAMLKAQAQLKAEAMAKVKKTPWAEYHATKKRLESMDHRISDLTWRLDLAKIRGVLGDRAFESLFPPEIRRFRGETEQLDVMANTLDVLHELDKRRRLLPVPVLSAISGAQSDVKDLEEELSRLNGEYDRLWSERGIPDFSGMTEADRAAEAERLREEALQEASRLLVEDGDVVAARRRQAKARFLDFDPKQEGIYYNTSVHVAINLDTFDLAEESPIGAMRFTSKVFKEKEIELNDAVNILSVKVARCDVGFPIQVYGTVVARDCTDYKRVYLFHRDRQHCQVINSKDEPLILTGPKRGLLLLDDNYVETDLMIKDHQGQDRELSKGVLTIRGVAGRPADKCEIGRGSLATRLSTVKLSYAVVVSALEATVSIEVLEGGFCGIVTGHTTSVKNRLVLYDSQLADDHNVPGNGRGAIKLMRPVVSVYFEDTLIIIVRVHGGKDTCIIFTPRTTNGDEVEFTLGTTKMRLRVDWSILDLVAAEY